MKVDFTLKPKRVMSAAARRPASGPERRFAKK
jgi:hypothetical protein